MLLPDRQATIGLTFALLCGIGSCLFAEDFQVGDHVKFTHFRESYEGTIVEKVGSGFVFRVEYEDEHGSMSRTTVRPGEMERLKDENPAGLAERVWSDASGQHKVRATFVEQSESHVKIKKQDGQIKELPINSLAAADQTYLAALRIPDESPFAGGHIDNGIAPPESATRKVDTMKPTPGEWTYQPKPVIPAKPMDDTLTLPKGRVLKGIHQRGNYVLLSQSVEGNDRIGPASFHRDSTNGLFITSVEGEDVFHLTSKALRASRGYSASLVGDDYLLVAGESFATLWNWQLKEPVYRIPLEMGLNKPRVLSSSGLMLVDADHNQRSKSVANKFLVDIVSGKSVGGIDVPYGRQPNYYRLSPDGKKLIGGFPSRIYVWDLEDEGSRFTIDYQHDKSMVGGVHFIDDFLFSGGVLVDMRLGAVVWKYQAEQPFMLNRVGESQFQLTMPTYEASGSKGKGKAVGPVITIPDPKLADQLKDVKRSDLLRLKRGTPVKLVTKLDGLDADEQSKVNLHLRSLIAATGARVDDEGDFVLEARIESLPPKSATVTYYYEGRQRKTLEKGNVFKAPFTNHTLSLSYKGNTLITTERQYGHQDQTVPRLKPDQTLEEAIKAAGRPRRNFFTQSGLSLGATVLPGGKTEFGITKLTIPELKQSP